MRRTNDAICIKCTLFVLSVVEFVPNNQGFLLYYVHVFVKNMTVLSGKLWTLFSGY